MKKIIILSLSALILIICAFFFWNRYASTTNIALVNFPKYQLADFIKSNDNRFIKYKSIPLDKLKDLKKYDVILSWGMGLKIDEKQRSLIQKAADNNIPTYTVLSTNPKNTIQNLHKDEINQIESYLATSHKDNYKNLARYFRRNLDKKIFFAPIPDSARSVPFDVFYHLAENSIFSNVNDYEKYLQNNNLYKKDAPKIILAGGLSDPFSGNRDNIDSMIVAFQNADINVYPIFSGANAFKMIKSVNPDAIIYFPHGRVGKKDDLEWLKQRNIPLFCPVVTLESREEWEKNKMGMMGGFMSQSIAMPEFSGGIYPFLLSTQEPNKEGYYETKTIPDRLKKFTQIVKNFLTLKKKKNAEKKIAIYINKGVNKSGPIADGLNVMSSLYELLKRLASEGYDLTGLPKTQDDFQKDIMMHCHTLSANTKGLFDEFIKTGSPDLIDTESIANWIKATVPSEEQETLKKTYGEISDDNFAIKKGDKVFLPIPRLQYGNVAILPQQHSAIIPNDFEVAHGVDQAPPYLYIATYLWSKNKLKADAIIHFGTHGNFEFMPSKQLILSDHDWPDMLIGSTPFFYYYTIANRGEAMIAKRRAYATIISHLTPPFRETNLNNIYGNLENAIEKYFKINDEKSKKQQSIKIKGIVLSMGLHRDLKLDSIPSTPYTENEIEKIENFAEELLSEKINGVPYITGHPYSKKEINKTIILACSDPIAYGLSQLDLIRGKISQKQLDRKSFFNRQYLVPAKITIKRIIGSQSVDSLFTTKLANITTEEAHHYREMTAPPKKRFSMKDLFARKSQNRQEKKIDEQEIREKKMAEAFSEIERSVNNAVEFYENLKSSPTKELDAFINALNGGRIEPGMGGDLISSPKALPTGRNLFSINPEATPDASSWAKGVTLAKNTIDSYYKLHKEYPKKICYTFWSSEFIESKGATIAQALYMLGAEPVWDSFGRVSGVRLIDEEKLGRPRIDIVVQTSGQFRDLAASRLQLLSKAIEMASASKSNKFKNYVSDNTKEVEHDLIEQGLSPRSARYLSTKRIFGGQNGMPGTGIQNFVKSGDKWESEKQIAEVYMHNMGALYDSPEDWGNYTKDLLKHALKHTDVVIQPRQSNTWGALSLDHVYEFMGGINLSIRNVTGKDPDAFLADYRNKNKMKIQDLKEAIGLEARATIFNPSYINDVIKNSKGMMGKLEFILTNVYGWNVMKSDVIGHEFWDKVYETYIKDVKNTGIRKAIEEKNPAVLEGITSVMLETARKGMWKPGKQILQELSQLHSTIIKKHGSSGATFATSNEKLQNFIAGNLSSENAQIFDRQMRQIKTGNAEIEIKKGTVLKEEKIGDIGKKSNKKLRTPIVISIVVLSFLILLVLMNIRRRKK